MARIHTLDARDTVFFEAVMQHSALTYADLGPELRDLHDRTIELLGRGGVDYGQLRKAFVPQTDRHDVALVFDTTVIDSGVYGMDVAALIVPLRSTRAASTSSTTAPSTASACSTSSSSSTAPTATRCAWWPVWSTTPRPGGCA